MRTGDNYRFGHKIWADILVKDLPKPEIEQIPVLIVEPEPV